MLVNCCLRYSTKASCCHEPVSLLGPIVKFTNCTSDHISSSLGKNPGRNGSAAFPGIARRKASADIEAPPRTMNLRRDIDIGFPPIFCTDKVYDGHSAGPAPRDQAMPIGRQTVLQPP